MYGSTNIDFDSVVVIRKTRREVNAAVDGWVFDTAQAYPTPPDLCCPLGTGSARFLRPSRSGAPADATPEPSWLRVARRTHQHRLEQHRRRHRGDERKRHQLA